MKRFLSTFWLIALLGAGMAFLGSCSNDEDDPTEDDAVAKLDDVDFVKRNLIITDASGNYAGLKWGVLVDESRPTTAFVGVEDADEIQEMWEGLIPYDVTVKTDGGDKVAELTDISGKKQGEMRLHNVNSGEVMAEITFSKPNLIDAHVSQVVFIPAALWPQNDITTLTPMPTILERKTTGEKYAVLREPSATGTPGYIMHVGQKRYFTDRQHEDGKALALQYFPSTEAMIKISGSLSKNAALWDVFTKATETPMTASELKTVRFFTSHNEVKLNCVFTLGTRAETKMAPLNFNLVPKAETPEYAGFWHYTSRVYVMTIDNADYRLTMDHNFTVVPGDMIKEINLTFDDFNLRY